MSGARLCGLLAELGYEGANNLDPDSFEWPFQYEDARPILDWICNNLRSSNVLSPSDLYQYEEFLRDGKLLEGQDLDFAHDSISAFSSRRDDQEAIFGAEESLKDIRDATVAYKEESIELQRQLRYLQTQCDMFTGQISALIQGRRARVSSSSTVTGHLASLDDTLSARDLRMNEVLEKIASSAQELSHYHSVDEGFIYLAYSDFHHYLREDASCINEIKTWFSKQLDSGPYRLVAEEGKSKSFDNVSNSIARERVSELQRLRSIFGISERQWVEAHADNSKQQGILQTLKSQISSDDAHIHLDLLSLRKKHSELTTELSSLHQKEKKLLSETIPVLCWDLAQLQDTYILQGDYDLKVTRQEHYIKRQKSFITHLVSQLARHQFLRIACRMEKRNTLDAYSLLRVVESELQSYLASTKGRIGRCLSLTRAASDTQEQGSVDDRDVVLHGIRDLLGTHVGPSSYVSAPRIAQQIGSLASELVGLQFDLETSLPHERNRCINEMCTLIRNMQQLLFASSTTAQPVLTARALMKELDEMEKMNVKLSGAVEEVTMEHYKKNEIVKHHSQEVGLQRRAFVDFFCNPERLKSQVRELSSRVR